MEVETNYSKHAEYWDWDGYDRSGDFEFWSRMGDKYGRNIFSPMCAIGQAAAYLADKGYKVTALDYTEEMILEGRKRFGNTQGLEFVRGDIRDFNTDKLYDFCFIDGADIHLLPSLSDVKAALANIGRHLRAGGGFGLEIRYPPEKSHSYPMKRFDPRVPRNDGTVIWKEGDSNYDAAAKRQDIHQVIHVIKDNKDFSIEHFVSLRYYDKEEMFGVFRECGFMIGGAYCDREFHKSCDPYENCFIELVKI